MRFTLPCFSASLYLWQLCPSCIVIMSEFDDLDLPRTEHLSPYPRRARPEGPASGPAHTNENTYDRFEQFLLADGEKKVEMTLDTRSFFLPPYTLRRLANFSQECQIHVSSSSTRKTILWVTFCVLDYFKIVMSPSPPTRLVAS